MALDHDLVQVLGLLVVVGLEREVVKDEQIDLEQAAELGLVAGVQAGRAQPLEQALSAEYEPE